MKQIQGSDEHLHVCMENLFINGWGTIIYRCELYTNGVQHLAQIVEKMRLTVNRCNFDFLQLSHYEVNCAFSSPNKKEKNKGSPLKLHSHQSCILIRPVSVYVFQKSTPLILEEFVVR